MDSIIGTVMVRPIIVQLRPTVKAHAALLVAVEDRAERVQEVSVVGHSMHQQFLPEEESVHDFLNALAMQTENHVTTKILKR